MDGHKPPAGRVFEVEIAGVPLRLKSSHNEQTVKELVELVDGKVRAALGASKTGSIQNAVILASLNLAEEFLMLKRKTMAELDHLESRAQKVLMELESSRASQTSLNASQEAQPSGAEI
ncbi:MAG: cell division protein ZapA [Bdellovibrionaceae bacterium]|nr:cell division protein ZapA [Pseudobdellovibrionaceae bacterium]